MKHGSLFSGIGGFDLAAEWMGWENVFHCEWMEFPRKVLDYYWPDADSHTDICKTDFTKYEGTVDIISGGFPCQPFSLAGKRKGTSDERYLWHEMLRAIREVKPKWVIAENVFGITNIDGGMVFEQVCLDLENEGYEVQPFIIPAAAKDAPHRRDRCWFIAYTNSGTTGPSGTSGSIKSNGSNRNLFTKQWRKPSQFNNRLYALSRNATDTDSRGLERSIEVGWNGNNVIRQSEFGNATDTYLPRFKDEREQSKPTTQSKRIEYSSSRWEQFPTQSPICSGDDGLPTQLDGITFSKWRNESIKGYGNAIVPQIALQLFQIIDELQKLE